MSKMSKKQFFIPQIEEETKKDDLSQNIIPPRKEEKYESEGFISSLYGRNVKNTDYYPGVEQGTGNTRRYETLKENRTDYAEFDQYIFNKKSNIFSEYMFAFYLFMCYNQYK